MDIGILKDKMDIGLFNLKQEVGKNTKQGTNSINGGIRCW